MRRSVNAPALLLAVVGCFVGIGTLALGGCSPSLGPCDEDAANRFVVDGEGTVMYAGQALINSSCAYGSCHTSGVEGSSREGVPFGLDFDLPVGEVDALGEPDPDFLGRLTEGSARVSNRASSIWAEVHAGTMPPSGRSDLDAAVQRYVLVDYDLGRCDFGDSLPSLRSSEGRQILKSWLACGAPVVEARDPLLADFDDGAVGLRTPVCDAEPTTNVDPFTLMYEGVNANCTFGCHSPGGTSEDIDLSTAALAYEVFTTRAPTTDDCSVSISNVMVDTANPSQSYLLHKLEDSTIPRDQRPICGDPMPSLLPHQPRLTARVRAWIETGAPPPP